MRTIRLAAALTAVASMLAALDLSGCVTARETYTPSGAQGFAVTCNGKLNSWDDCLAKAGDMCRERGYMVLEKNGEQLPFAFSSASATSDIKAKLFSYKEHDTANAFAASGIHEKRSMLVQCGVPQRHAQTQP